MLLSGIYYGKTLITRAYKSGEIIWSVGIDKHIDFEALNIHFGMMAQITPSALELLRAEYNINMDNNAEMHFSPPNDGVATTEIYLDNHNVLECHGMISLGEIPIYIVSNSQVAIEESELISAKTKINTDGNVEEQLSSSDITNIDHTIEALGDTILNDSISKVSNIATSLSKDADVDMSSTPSRNSVVDQDAVFDINTNGQASKSQISQVDVDINCELPIDIKISPSENGSVDEILTVNDDVDARISQSQVSVINEKPLLVIEAEYLSQPSAVGIIDTDIVEKTEADVKSSQSRNGNINEKSILDIDALAHSSDSQVATNIMEISSELDVSSSISKSDAANVQQDFILQESIDMESSSSSPSVVVQNIQIDNFSDLQSLESIVGNIESDTILVIKMDGVSADVVAALLQEKVEMQETVDEKVSPSEVMGFLQEFTINKEASMLSSVSSIVDAHTEEVKILLDSDLQGTTSINEKIQIEHQLLEDVSEEISKTAVTSLHPEIIVENIAKGVAPQSSSSNVQISTHLVENSDIHCSQTQAVMTDNIQTILDNDVDINSSVEEIIKNEDLQIISVANTAVKSDESFLIESNELNIQLGAVLILCSGKILKFILNENISADLQGDVAIILPHSMVINQYFWSDSDTNFIQIKPLLLQIAKQIKSDSFSAMDLKVPYLLILEGTISSGNTNVINNEVSYVLKTSTCIEGASVTQLIKELSWALALKKVIQINNLSECTNGLSNNFISDNTIFSIQNDATADLGCFNSIIAVNPTITTDNNQSLSLTQYYEMSESNLFEIQCDTKSNAALSFDDFIWEYPIQRGTDLLITQVYGIERYPNGITLN